MKSGCAGWFSSSSMPWSGASVAIARPSSACATYGTIPDQSKLAGGFEMAVYGSRRTLGHVLAATDRGAWTRENGRREQARYERERRLWKGGWHTAGRRREMSTKGRKRWRIGDGGGWRKEVCLFGRERVRCGGFMGARIGSGEEGFEKRNGREGKGRGGWATPIIGSLQEEEGRSSSSSRRTSEGATDQPRKHRAANQPCVGGHCQFLANFRGTTHRSRRSQPPGALPR